MIGGPIGHDTLYAGRSSPSRFVDDSPLEEAVSSEPVSAPLFPANREKYREIFKRLAVAALVMLK